MAGLSRRSRLGLVFGAALVAAAALPVSKASAESPLLGPAERAALELRLMQTELMVAALSCNARASYNTFVTRYQQTLVAGGRTLRSMFRAVHGRNATRRLDSFITRVANEASRRSLRDVAGFCSRNRDAFAALNGGSVSIADYRARFRCLPAAGLSTCTLVAEDGDNRTVAAREEPVRQ